MECRIFANLSGIDTEKIGSMQLVDFFLLSKFEGNTLDIKVFDEKVIIQMGNIEAIRFCDTPYIWTIQDFDGADLRNIVRVYNGSLNSFLSFLWFVKDNSVSLLTTYGYVPELDDNNFNFRRNGYHFSKCTGEFEITTFTKEDFVYTETIFSKIRDIVGLISPDVPVTPKNEKVSLESPRFNKTKYNDSNRISRAITFLQLARTQSFLPLKISFYTAILECLFTSDNQEVSHKVAERVAYYLGDADKYYTYKKVKLAYDLRSKFFHGQTLEKKVSTVEQQRELSIIIDDYIRRILTKIIMEDSEKFLNEDYLTPFINSLLFASNSPLDDYNVTIAEKEKNKNQNKK